MPLKPKRQPVSEFGFCFPCDWTFEVLGSICPIIRAYRELACDTTNCESILKRHGLGLYADYGFLSVVSSDHPILVSATRLESHPTSSQLLSPLPR